MSRFLSLLCLTALLAALAMRLSYKEDISDFLPLGTSDREALAIYQDISGANELYILFANPGSEDTTALAVSLFCSTLERMDTARMARNVTAQVDIEAVQRVQDFVYHNIPCFLTPHDYRRMDSLLSLPGYVERQVRQDYEALLFPTGGMTAMSMGRDPLNLFAPVMQSLAAGRGNAFETYDGYLFTSDMSRAVVMLESPYGNAETEHNARLVALLEECVKAVGERFPTVGAHIVGGPQIAVGNASRIRSDAVTATALAVVMILVLLFLALRSVRNILLIVLSIGWGWLFALGGMALLHDSVSVIVIGISSVILGIAVNYPLHLVAHASHQTDMRKALREIVTPLVVGNITTVGAFMTLVPLQSAALRDLGLFASLLLVGTILFVVVYLPHYVRPRRISLSSRGPLARLAAVRLENRPWLIVPVALLTLLFGYYSMDTEFDTSMSSINYLTEQQRQDMAYFQTLSGESPDSATLYIPTTASTADSALTLREERGGMADASLTRFLPSMAEQRRRIALWHAFTARYAALFGDTLDAAAARAGFSADAFTPFRDVLRSTPSPLSFNSLGQLTATVLRGSVSTDSAAGRFTVVDRVQVPASRQQDYVAATGTRSGQAAPFTVQSMNSAMAEGLSDNFNYIGLACSAIVFIFLWCTMGRIELALLAFLPMAVSWLWILGIMSMMDVRFNIVNIILATFIFGQGDDYTIFMTEGCQYEYAHRRRMLDSYRGSIILSALIMFIGIGTLIVAQHPALRSLAQVTIIGMSSVVLMAWLLPPLVFNWLTRRHGRWRRRPLTLCSLLRGVLAALLSCPCRLLPRRAAAVWCRLALRLIPGLRHSLRNPGGETLDRPCIMVCRRRSPLDTLFLTALSPRIVTVAEDADHDTLLHLVDSGHIVAAPRYSAALRAVAVERRLDIVPVHIHGTADVMPPDGHAVHSGTVTVVIDGRMTAESRGVEELMEVRYTALRRELETPQYLISLVRARYIYKGVPLRRLTFSAVPTVSDSGTLLVTDCGYGAQALMLALLNPDSTVTATDPDPDKLNILRHAASGMADNLVVMER